VLVFNLTAWMSTTDDIAQVTVVPTMPSVTLLRWSDAAGRVPARTLPVVKLVAPVFALLVVNWIHHGCCVKHRLEALDMCVDFFVVFG
jgi:hypothetical protein